MYHTGTEEGCPPELTGISFIHASSSRSALACSKDQLLYILTHYQAMPPFLDHVLSFCGREEPHLQACFRSEDYLSVADLDLAIGELGRSGAQVQHCFNLVGVEYDGGQIRPYLYRQTAAYYSFDPVEGVSMWVILKANKVIRNRIQQAAGFPQQNPALGDLSTPESSFSASLNAHLLILEWSIENWDSHISFLENKMLESSRFVKYTPVAGLKEDTHIEQGISRRTTYHPGNRPETQSRQNTGLPRQLSRISTTATWKRLAEVGRRLLMPAARKQNKSQDNAVTPQQSKPILNDLDLDTRFSFDQLQALHQLATELEDGNLVLGQNQRVIEAMIHRFESLKRSSLFNWHIQVDNTSFEAFFLRARRCLRELGNHQARLNALQGGLEKDISLVSSFSPPSNAEILTSSQFNGILQYKNMRTGEYFAHHAKVSTEKMEELTVKSRQETISIHVITILTLIFFSGTFVAVRYRPAIVPP